MALPRRWLWSPYAALEYEFFMFTRPLNRRGQRAFRDSLNPDTPDWFGLFDDSQHSVCMPSCINRSTGTCPKAPWTFQIARRHCQYAKPGPACWRLLSRFDRAKRPRQGALFQDFMKVLAPAVRGYGELSCQMWSASIRGRVANIHVSLRDKNTDKSSILTTLNEKHSMSKDTKAFLLVSSA